MVICALVGGITNKIGLFASNQTFCPPPNFLAPQTFGQVMLLPAGASCQTCERIVLLLVFIVYCVIITWQQIFKCSLQVMMLGVLSNVTLARRHLARQCSEAVTADKGKQGRQRALALHHWTFKRETTGAKVSFLGNFMIYQDRIETSCL